MSSGTVSNVGEVGRLLRGHGGDMLEEEGPGPSGPLTARQLELNRLWTFYRCANYDNRRTAWDGSPVLDHLEMETIVTAGFTPAGYFDAGGSTLPLRFRRPTAPGYLTKAIVSRFNGLLFGAKRHPNVVVADDPKTDDWITGFCEVTRLWSKMLLARTYGGAMGSVGVGFVFKNGVPRVQVHDPRWCNPTFEDREEFVLRRFEKRYQYRDQIVLPSGDTEERWFWYRRVIDKEKDVVWPRVPVEDVGQQDQHGEPKWSRYEKLVTHHGFGFVPVVWIQNNEVQEDIDGDPDCHGAYDMIEEIDMLVSQSNRGIVANCDPTLHISTDDEVPDNLRKGSDNSIKTSAGGQVSYLEINGTGPKAAMEQADALETRVLRLCRCVLEDNFGGPARTEKEVDQNYSNMLEQADMLREQYGERGVKRLLSMVLSAARKLAKPRSVQREDGTSEITRAIVRLPPNKTTGEPRELGEGQNLELDWPDWYEPSLDQVNTAVSAAGQAMNFGLVDREHAVRFVAEYFSIENVQELVEALEAKEAAQLESAMGGYDTSAPADEGEVDELDPALLAELEGVDPLADEYDIPIEEDVPAEPSDEELEALAAEVVDPLDQGLEEAAPTEEPVEQKLEPSQLKELLSLVDKVYTGTLPRPAAVEIIRVAFPVFEEAAIMRMLGGEAALGGGNDTEVQKTALNGAQVTALAGIVEKVAQGLLDRSSGASILQVAFGLTASEAEAVLGDPNFEPAVTVEGADTPPLDEPELEVPEVPEPPDADIDLPEPPEVPEQELEEE